MTDIARLAINSKELLSGTKDLPTGVKMMERKIVGRFLRGPIPWTWLVEAAKLPGRTLHLGIALWHLEGFQQTGTVKLKPSLCRELGMDRHASYRALRELERAGLILVVRKPGAAAMVTLILESAEKLQLPSH